MFYSFDTYKDKLSVIESLPEKKSYNKQDLLTEDLRLYSSTDKQEVEVYYTPFDYYEEDAKISLIGITPGWTQMELAIRVFRKGLTSHTALPKICEELEEKASFGGSMRKNLTEMLDQLEIHHLLGINSTAELFSSRHDLLHTTSVLRYPVFVNGENYTGHKPDILTYQKFTDYIEQIFIPEMQAVTNSLVIPLGKAVADVLERLTQRGVLDDRRCLLGFPHPSGANGHRKKHFEARKDALKRLAKEWITS